MIFVQYETYLINIIIPSYNLQDVKILKKSHSLLFFRNTNNPLTETLRHPSFYKIREKNSNDKQVPMVQLGPIQPA